MLLDQQWTEIWCSLCGANAKANGNGFYNGIIGLHSHIVREHRPGLRIDNVVPLCSRRVLSHTDVRRITDGLQPVVEIEAKFPVVDKDERVRLSKAKKSRRTRTLMHWRGSELDSAILNGETRSGNGDGTDQHDEEGGCDEYSDHANGVEEEVEEDDDEEDKKEEYAGERQLRKRRRMSEDDDEETINVKLERV